MAESVAPQSMALIIHPHYPLVVEPVKPPPKTGMNALPTNVLHSIASYMGAKSLLTFELVNTHARHACNDDQFWKRLVLAQFGWRPPAEPASMGTTWKAIYRFQHTMFTEVVMRKATDMAMHMRLRGMPSIQPGMGFAPVYAQ